VSGFDLVSNVLVIVHVSEQTVRRVQLYLVLSRLGG